MPGRVVHLSSEAYLYGMVKFLETKCLLRLQMAILPPGVFSVPCSQVFGLQSTCIYCNFMKTAVSLDHCPDSEHLFVSRVVSPCALSQCILVFSFLCFCRPVLTFCTYSVLLHSCPMPVPALCVPCRNTARALPG